MFCGDELTQHVLSLAGGATPNQVFARHDAEGEREKRLVPNTMLTVTAKRNGAQHDAGGEREKRLVPNCNFQWVK